MLAKGIGDALERVGDMPSCTLVIAIGEEGISTPRAYAALDEKYDFFKEKSEPDATVFEMIDLWKNDALSASCPCFYNIFESVVPQDNVDVDAIKRILRENGAMQAMMSGSGPSVFGVFETQNEAEQACFVLQEKGYKAFVCHPSGQYTD